jgi:hypothetical protein
MTGLMFRIVNARDNQIIDLSVEVNLSMFKKMSMVEKHAPIIACIWSEVK